MSENVDLVRHSMEAFNERDLRTAAEALDQEVEWDTAPLIDEQGIRGRAAVLEFWERTSTTFPLVLYESHPEALKAVGLEE
jgi:limonene-1,2-epoxide hydrolase